MDLKIKFTGKILNLLFLVFLTGSCADNKILALRSIESQPLKKLALHSVNLDREFTGRIVQAPAVIVDSINKMDSTGEYSNCRITSNEKTLFSKYYNLLPAEYRELMEKKVIAVYFIKNFKGGGMTDCVFDQNGEMYIALYLNPVLLRTTLNEWITYRDQSSFTVGDGKVSVKSSCGSGHPGLLQTLVHESSHIYDYYYHVTPYVEKWLQKPGDKNVTEFVSGVWKDYKLPVEQADFPYRIKVSSYGLGEKIDIALAADLYRNLGKTPFSSLYGSSSWAEDFAETFTWYYLNKKFGIRYKVTVSSEGYDPVIFTPAENKTVTARYKYLEMISDQ